MRAASFSSKKGNGRTASVARREGKGRQLDSLVGIERLTARIAVGSEELTARVVRWKGKQGELGLPVRKGRINSEGCALEGKGGELGLPVRKGTIDSEGRALEGKGGELGSSVKGGYREEIIAYVILNSYSNSVIVFFYWAFKSAIKNLNNLLLT